MILLHDTENGPQLYHLETFEAVGLESDEFSPGVPFPVSTIPGSQATLFGTSSGLTVEIWVHPLTTSGIRLHPGLSSSNSFCTEDTSALT